MNLSFAGCGFLGIYHVGVAACFKKYAPHLIVNKISGASAGAIAACGLLCDLPLGEITTDVLRVVREARAKTLGPFSPSFNVQSILREGLERVLPDDAHLRVNGRLHVSLTRVYDGKNVMVTHFHSKDDLIQALLCSCFIPLFSGFLPPRLHGVRYIDGCYSDNLPILDENTITVSPFCGESDICPRDNTYNFLQINLANTSIELSRQNIYRFARILFPPKPEILTNMCKQGFDDALRYLTRNNLINCTRCLNVQSTFVVSNTLDESFDYDPQCHECKQQRQEALVDKLPDTVLTIFQDAIDSANKGIINWVFKHRGVKLLSILSLPCILPADIAYATFLKFLRIAPKIGHNLLSLSKSLIEHLEYLLTNVDKRQDQITTKITCQLAITEYGDSKIDIDSIREMQPAVKSKVNFGFTINLDEKDLPTDQDSALKLQNRVLDCASRKQTLGMSHMESGIDDDTFEHILTVTSQHEALMAFYYMDDNNDMKVTEIFDVTEADTSAVLSPDERETNAGLEFDNNWEDGLLGPTGNWGLSQTNMDDDGDGLADSSLDISNEPDSGNVYSDPESEWSAHSPGKTCQSPAVSMFCNSDLRPESDQLGKDDAVSMSKSRLSAEIPSHKRKPSYVIIDS